eukprot:7813542-Lingulodinium_polyedra.AAC.1
MSVSSPVFASVTTQIVKGQSPRASAFLPGGCQNAETSGVRVEFTREDCIGIAQPVSFGPSHRERQQLPSI